MTLTLDTSYPQVLIDYLNDEHGFRWHARLLAVADGNGRWIGATPDGEIELIDLTWHRVRPLERVSSYPEDLLEETYGFGELDDGGIAELARRCHGLARVLGFGRQVEPEDDGHWRIADAALASFGEIVPEAAVADQGSFVSRGRSGVVLLDDVRRLTEFVPSQKEAQWRLEKGALGGHDFRVVAVARDGQGRRSLSADDALGMYRDEDQKEWPCKGPRRDGVHAQPPRRRPQPEDAPPGMVAEERSPSAGLHRSGGDDGGSRGRVRGPASTSG